MAVKVKMLRNQAGCPDGINSVMYFTGQEYLLPSNLARLFLEIKAAEEVKIPPEMVRGAPVDEDDLEELTEEEERTMELMADVPEDLNIQAISKMNSSEKKELKYLVKRLDRIQLEHLIEREELSLRPTANWKDETVVNRVLEALGL